MDNSLKKDEKLQNIVRFYPTMVLSDRWLEVLGLIFGKT
jgi:hypothetical protein